LYEFRVALRWLERNASPTSQTSQTLVTETIQSLCRECQKPAVISQLLEDDDIEVEWPRKGLGYVSRLQGRLGRVFEGRGHSEVVVPRQINNAELRRVVVPRQNTRKRDLREASGRMEWDCKMKLKLRLARESTGRTGFRRRQGWPE
jgi:hypothetical protein